MLYSKLKKIFLDIYSTNFHTLVPPLLPVCRNLQHRNLLPAVSVTSATPFQSFHHQRNIYHVSRPSCQPLYRTNTSHREQETFLYEYLYIEFFYTDKTQNRKLLFGSTPLQHGRHFDNWNQPLNMRMRACYLYCHAAGLCCDLVIHRKTITFITDFLLPIITCLLTLPCS
jgi:hypothetical protein